MDLRLPFAPLACVVLLGTTIRASGAEPKVMAGVWRGHSAGKQELAFGIVRSESDDQYTVSNDLRTVTRLPLAASFESGGKMQPSPVHAVATTLTTEARIESGELVAKRVTQYSTGENRETWTFRLRSPSVLHVQYASSYILPSGRQLSWHKTEGTLQRP
ncbi:MAG: hypothetical protein ABJF10_04135 [Chthoniobacter sp.]|uniref:hypothetical protein n=1 Tax=Chthoniobacter sp. TaxID=2510640 RepID=UPI0032A24684